MSKSNEITWCSDTLTHTVDQTFNITSLLEGLTQTSLEQSILEQFTNCLLTLLQNNDIEQRLTDPAAQETSSHRRTCAIENPEQRTLCRATTSSLEEFKIATCIGIKGPKATGGIGL